MHRASYRFMPPCGITETLSDVESVRVVHEKVGLHVPVTVNSKSTLQLILSNLVLKLYIVFEIY